MPLEHVNHTLVHHILSGTWILKGSKLEAVVLEHPLLRIGHAKSGEHTLPFELEGGFACSVLHNAKHLQGKLRILNDAPAGAHLLVADVTSAGIALVLNLYKICVDDAPEHLEDVSHYLVSRNRADQLNVVLGVEVCGVFLGGANYAQVAN